jgi:hypothetical protein
MSLENFSFNQVDSKSNVEKSNILSGLDFSNPDKLFTQLSELVTLMKESAVEPLEIYNHFSLVYEKMPAKFKADQNLDRQSFLSKIGISNNPDNVIKGEFDGVFIDLNFVSLSNESFNSLKTNFDFFVSHYDLSNYEISTLNQEIVLQPKVENPNNEFIQKIFINENNVQENKNSLAYKKQELLKKIVTTLGLTNDTTFYDAIHILYSLSHLYRSLFMEVESALDDKTFYNEVTDLQTGEKRRYDTTLVLFGYRILVSQKIVNEYNPAGLLTRAINKSYNLIDDFTYSSNGNLEKCVRTKNGVVQHTLYYDRESSDPNIKIVREVPVTSNCILVYNLDSDQNELSRYIILDNGAKVSAFPLYKQENPDATKQDYYQFLSDNINSRNYQFFYNHLFRYTSDEIVWKNSEQIEISGDYWQSPDETLFRVDKGVMLGDCDDIAFLSHQLGNLKSNIYQNFKVAITSHALNVQVEIQNGEFILTRYGTFGADSYRADTFVKAMNLLLSTYDRGGEGRSNPVLDRVGSDLGFLVKFRDQNYIVKTPLEMVSYLKNSDELINLLEVFGVVDPNEYSNQLDIIQVNDSTGFYNGYFFEFSKIKTPGYLESLKNTTDNLLDAFFESTMIDAIAGFEEFVSNADNSIDFDSERMHFVDMLTLEHSENDAINVLEELVSKFPDVKIYSDALASVVPSDSVSLETNVFSSVKKFLENPSINLLIDLLPNEKLHGSYVFQIEKAIEKTNDLALYSYFIIFYPARISLNNLLMYNGSVDENLKDLIFNKVENTLYSLNQDSQFEIQYAFEVVSKFMPEKFPSALEIFANQISKISLPLLVSKIDANMLLDKVSQFKDHLDNPSYNDFQCLICVLTKDLTKLETLISACFFNNIEVFKLTLKIISTQRPAANQLMLFLKQFFTNNQIHNLKSEFDSFVEKNNIYFS